MEPERKHLVLVVGPTGVGKSATALSLAEALGGEIVSCDSMQVYRGFDIGTDKPSLENRQRIRHHLLDLIDSTTQFTAGAFAVRALDAITEIRRRGKVPLIVGGTGLYFKALLDGLFPGPGSNSTLRQSLASEAATIGLDALWQRLEAVDAVYARKIGQKDRIRIIRALEVYSLTQIPISEQFRKTQSCLEDFQILRIGLQLPRAELYRRIEARVDRMFETGLVQEVRRLLAEGASEQAPPFRALGYKHVLEFLRNQITLEEAVAATKIDTRHYAKRQMTWFKKMPDVNWFSPCELPAILSFIQARLR